MHRRQLLGAIAGGAASVAMSPLQRVVVLGRGNAPSLDLNFLAGFDPRVAFSRASLAWDFDASGSLLQFATDAPRVGPSGLLVEEQRTNGIRNPRCEGAVVGSPGTLPTDWAIGSIVGVTTSVAGAGFESGIPYVEIAFAGTGSGGLDILLDGSTAIAAVNGQVWTGSAFVKLASGAPSNATMTLKIREMNSSGTPLVSSNTPFVPTSASLRSQRVTHTRTNSNANTAFEQVSVSIATAGAVAFTLRIGIPQLELGAFVTSPIMPPAGSPAASTRATDTANIPVGSWFNPNSGGLVVGAIAPIPVVTESEYPASFYKDLANRFGVRIGGGISTPDVTAGVSNVFQFLSPSVIVSQSFKAGMSWNGAAISAATNGTVVSGSMPMPTGIVGLALGGATPGNSLLNSYLQSVIYWPRALSPSELRGATVA